MKKVFAIVLMTALLVCPVFASAEAGNTAAASSADVYASVEVTRAATCAEAGLLTYTLTDGTVFEVEVPASGEHSYAVTETPATCTEDGSVTSVCSVCGDTVTEVIPATGHNYVYQNDYVVGKDGNFTSYGTWVCETCGAVVDATEGNAVYYYEKAQEEAAAEETAEEAVEETADETAEEAAEPAAGETASAEASGEAAAADAQNGKWVGIEVVVVLVLLVELAIIMVSFKRKADK